MSRRVTLAVSVLVLVALVAASTALASGGNSSAAKQCQKGGWQTSETSNGAHFANQSDCVSYAAGGGTLFMPQVTARDLGCAVHPGFDTWEIDGTGFTPGSAEIVDGVLIPNHFFDSLGAISFDFIPDNAGVMLPLTLTDGNGVTASVTFGPTLSC